MKAIQKISNLRKKNPILLVGAVSVVAGLGIFGIAKGVSAYKNHKAEKEAKDNLTELQKKVLDSATNVQKVDDTKAKELAKQLLDAMDRIGTDLNTIQKIIIDDAPSSLDLLAIMTAFGIQEYGTFGKPLWGSGEKLNLIQWLDREISDMTTIYSLIKTAFQTAGVNWDEEIKKTYK